MDPTNGTQTESSSPSKSTLREYFESICVAVILALFIRTFVVQAFKIPTGSMIDNLLIGDHLLVNKMVYSPTGVAAEREVLPVRNIRRGDVIVFKYPAEPERDFIKRVIGLPGDAIRIEDKTVYINGEPLQEDYVYYPPGEKEEEGYSDYRRDNMPEMTVPPDQYFVMGDNRDNSHDSRFWGTLPRDLVKGRALIIYWSFEAPGEAYLATNMVDRIKGWAWMVVNFYGKTRKDRFFRLVR